MKHQRILLIDDEPDIHTITQIGLTLETEWEMLSALSGREGIELAAQEHPDAILLDAMMPGLDGIETLKELKELSTTQDIPVIFLTAKAQASDRRNFYLAGAKGIITKPFDPTTLVSQITGFLSWQL